MRWIIPVAILGLASAARAQTPSPSPSAEQIIRSVLDADPWGLAGAEVTAHVALKDKRGVSSDLAFTARSIRHAPPLAKSLVRFSAPADLAGAGFLQIQKDGGDDDRFLFLPELKRSRRISGNLRSNAFMGTDFSFADLDRRDVREGDATLKADENIGKYPCYRVDIVPKRADSQYARIELWVRKDNFIPLKSAMYDKSKTLLKTLSVEEVRRVSGHWFITRSKMENHKESHSTELFLDKITPGMNFPDDDFTVRALEKI